MPNTQCFNNAYSRSYTFKVRSTDYTGTNDIKGSLASVATSAFYMCVCVYIIY